MLGKTLVLACAQRVALGSEHVALLPSPICEPGERGPAGSAGHVGSLGPQISTPPARRVGMGWGAEGLWKPLSVSSSPEAPTLLSAIWLGCLRQGGGAGTGFVTRWE